MYEKYYKNVFDKKEIQKATLDYFSGDELATSVWMDKYALNSIDNKTGEITLYELTPNDSQKRLASETYRIGQKYNNNLSEDVWYALLKDFRYLMYQGSPTYGIGRKDPVSLSNCFVIGYPDVDSYGCICAVDEEQVQLMKRRAGVGHDLSGIRPKGSPVNNSAQTSTGVVPFMERYSNSTREVAQDGRRGALMLSISIDHPDAEDFIDSKLEDGNIEGANISVRMTDSFLNQAVSYSDNPDPEKQRLWKKIIYNATTKAEPGVLFWDTILRESPADCYDDLGFKTFSTNPCGEIPLSPYDSCRLTAHNLFGYVDNPFTPEASLNWKKLGEYAQYMMMMADNLVELELEKVKQIIKKIESDTESDELKLREKLLWDKVYTSCKTGRRTGIGILGLGDMLAALGIKYGTEEATEYAVRVYEFLTLNSYLMSYKLVQEHDRPSFEIFDYEREKDNPFLLRLTQSKNFPELSKEIERMWKNGKGRRNIAIMTIAPTGSTSIMSQTTSGLEPLFSPFYTRQKKIEKNSNLEPDTVDVNGDWFIKYNVIHYPFMQWYAVQENISFTEAKEIMEVMPEDKLNELFSMSPWFGATAQDCDWIERVNMQAGLQKWIDHSISVTVNLPKGTKPELVQTIYETAWQKGCKGCTIYVDGSKGNQILSVKTEEDKKELTHKAPTRPIELDASIIRFQNNREKWISVVGTLNGEPYEIFTGLAEKLNIPNSVTTGKIVKVDKRKLKTETSRYDFVYTNSETSERVEALNDIFNREYYNYAKLISGLLRHGMPVQYVVSTINSLKFDNDTINSWKSGVVRGLRKFIKDNTESGDKCPECGEKLRYESGCVQCHNCGYTQCA